MSNLCISEMVPCPEQEMDTYASDCQYCEHYEGRTDDSIICNYRKHGDPKNG